MRARIDELMQRANRAFDPVGAEPLKLKGEARPARVRCRRRRSA